MIEPHGALLPFGEHKGSGLALVCELLGGALAGGQAVKGPSDGKYNVLNSMLSILIDPNQLGTGDNLAREVESFVAWHTGSPPAPGVDKVKIAGEPERETQEEAPRRRHSGRPDHLAGNPGGRDEVRAGSGGDREDRGLVGNEAHR